MIQTNSPVVPNDGGFIITHPTKRNAFEVVTDFKRPYKGPDTLRTAVCPTCQVIHHFKTYHIMLDESGRCIVSPGVFNGLRKAGMGDLDLEDHTSTPPDQVLGAAGGMMGLVPSRPQIYISDPSEE